ncbi:MAG TPA: nuclease-related domain-containing protein [Chloroflexia bacterium]|nr:nuclease-related domain-containing protein [Chloroflexia bacterium]
MAVMHPATCPDMANGGERAVYAMIEAFLDGDWSAWFQTAVPGRTGNRHETPLRADFVLLGPTGLTVLEVKSWHAAAVEESDGNRVHFRNGATAQHPLVQAYRYAAELRALLRSQPGSLQIDPVTVRYAAALPYVHAGEVAGVPAFSGPQILPAESLGPALPASLAALLPIGGSVSPAQAAAIRRLLTRPEAHAAAGQGPLFEC